MFAIPLLSFFLIKKKTISTTKAHCPQGKQAIDENKSGSPKRMAQLTEQFLDVCTSHDKVLLKFVIQQCLESKVAKVKWLGSKVLLFYLSVMVCRHFCHCEMSFLATLGDIKLLTL